MANKMKFMFRQKRAHKTIKLMKGRQESIHIKLVLMMFRLVIIG